MEVIHKFTWNLTRNFDSSTTELANCLEAIKVWRGNKGEGGKYLGKQSPGLL